VLEHHVGSPDDTPGGPPCNTSHTDYWCGDNGPDKRSDDAAGPHNTGGAIDYGVCVGNFRHHGRGERNDGESRESEEAHGHLLCLSECRVRAGDT
jgi:hypothetical protein